ncbi:MAG: hypothetical protein ACW97X_03105 [Candidatus Hodarchaeales archaeon]|jgi:hypothetical protein
MNVNADVPAFYCSFCGALIHEYEFQKCLNCGAAFCQRCASHNKISSFNDTQLKCPCGSLAIESKTESNNLKSELLEQIFSLKRALKQVGYRPVIVLKRTGHLESQLRSFRKQFLTPINQIDNIFLETKKIENFILTEFHEYSSKLKRLYRNIMGLDSSFSDNRNLLLQLSLFQKNIASFDTAVQTKLHPIYELVEELEDRYNQIEEMTYKIGRYFNVFVFVPGELGIGYFSDIELRNSRISKISIDLIVTTDRIVMIRHKRSKIIKQKTIIHDEFPPEDLIDVEKTSTGVFKRDKLQITTIKHDYELRSDSSALMQIFDSLQTSYYGRPNDIYIFEPFRDWASENYQEKILNAINFRTDSANNTHRTPDPSPSQEKEPDFVSGVLDDRLRDLRLRKMANEKALQELKEGRKKVASREYFELVKQFELELAKINEAIRELLIRTGKTNILH